MKDIVFHCGRAKHVAASILEIEIRSGKGTMEGSILTFQVRRDCNPK